MSYSLSLKQRQSFRTDVSSIAEIVTKRSLHGQSSGDSVVDAFSSYGLACASPPSVLIAPGDTLPLCQLHRSIPLVQNCITWQAAACRSYCNFYCGEI